MQMVFSSQTNDFGASDKSITSQNSNSLSCFQYQNCNFRLIATHNRTTSAVSPVNEVDRLTSSAKIVAPFVFTAEWAIGKLCRLMWLTFMQSLKLNSNWYSGITSIWVIGLALKALTNCRSCKSILRSLAFCSTAYISKSPFRVPSKTWLSKWKQHDECKTFKSISTHRHPDGRMQVMANGKWYEPKLAIDSIWAEIDAGGHTVYASCCISKPELWLIWKIDPIQCTASQFDSKVNW